MDGTGFGTSWSPKEVTPKRKVTLLRYQRVLGTLLFVAGFIFVLITPVYKETQETRIESPVGKISSVEIVGSGSSDVNFDHGPFHPELSLFTEEIREDELPTRIIIPSLSLDLPVTPSRVVNGVWEISETTASFGLGSTPPGKIGNTVIFAHARRGFFGDLRRIKKDTVVYVLAKNGWYSYKINEIKTVLPTQIEVIAPTPDETLTLYTCSGFADRKRLIVQGKRV